LLPQFKTCDELFPQDKMTKKEIEEAKKEVDKAKALQERLRKEEQMRQEVKEDIKMASVKDRRPKQVHAPKDW
jgi:hypothetical protein